jgi:cell division protein FtsZ
MFELEDFVQERTGGSPVARIKVVGLGGAGGNVINNMIASNLSAVDYLAVNTDLQVLESSMADTKIQIGRNVTRGLGAGSKPEIGRQAALEDRDALAEHIAGADMVFITAGMGGGTGTGAAPVMAELAQEQGSLTVAVVTRPFFYEGGKRKKNAAEGIQALQKHVDTLIVIPNDRIGLVADRGTPLLESFSIANEVLKNAVKGITDLILVPGLINLDFADVRTVMEAAGRSVIGMGVGKGENAAHDAAKKAILNPLLENTSIDGASGILINITGGLELSLDDVHEATSNIFDSADEDANIIMGAVVDPDLKDEVRVTIIATGFEEEPQKAEISNVKRWSPTKSAPQPSVDKRGIERILAKTLYGSGSMNYRDSGAEDPLDIPTFLRKYEGQGEPRAEEKAKQEVQSANRQF